MRIAAVILLSLLANVALAEGNGAPDPVPDERGRWIEETIEVCLEGYSTAREFCYGNAVLMAAIELHVLEGGQKLSDRYDLDPGVGMTTAHVAKTCREKTMNAGRVDGVSGMVCVDTAVRALNQRERIKKREEGR